jgi:hypothetical protein
MQLFMYITRNFFCMREPLPSFLPSLRRVRRYICQTNDDLGNNMRIVNVENFRCYEMN